MMTPIAGGPQYVFIIPFGITSQLTNRSISPYKKEYQRYSLILLNIIYTQAKLSANNTQSSSMWLLLM